MSFLQGDPLPDVTVTTSKATQAPEYYTDYLSGLSSAGQAAMGRTAEQGIAAYDPLQTEGYGKVASGAAAYQPGLSAAQQTVGGLTGGFDTSKISSFMNPYTQNVVSEMERLSQQNVQRNLLPSMMAGFVGSGGLGSRRYADVLGQSMADVQSNLTGQQYGALSKGYSEALKAAMDDYRNQMEASKLQADLASEAQRLGLTEAGALTKAGAERQAYEQSKLDFPMKMATDAAALMRGYQVPTTETETRKGPLPGAYQTSGLQDLISISGLLGSAAAGRAGSNIVDLGRSIIDLFNEYGGGMDISEFVNQITSGYDPASSDYYPGGDDGGTV